MRPNLLQYVYSVFLLLMSSGEGRREKGEGRREKGEVSDVETAFVR